MHLSLFGIAIATSILVRWLWQPTEGAWSDRWQRALFALLLPAVLLFSTAIAVLGMGHHGHMLGHAVDQVGCILAQGLVGIAGLTLLLLLLQSGRSLYQIHHYEPWTNGVTDGRLLDSPDLYAAQVGFLHPELVVSRGLIESLPADHLQAVLQHEAAHAVYHDTFWFFWLGWVRRLTAWLPQTDALWHELLLLRELRADHWAAQTVDPLTLAEALLLVVRSPLSTNPTLCAAFHDGEAIATLEARIDALLTINPQPSYLPHWASWSGLVLGCLPLFTMLLHTSACTHV